MTSYTTPTTISTSDLITAAYMNTYWGDNLKHLHEAINSVVILQDQKAAGTNGGAFTSGSWATRTINTEVVDVNSNCTLSSNQFTLTAGTWEILSFTPANQCAAHQSRLYNATGAAVILEGTSEAAGAAASVTSHSVISGRFTVAGSQALEIQHRCTTTRATDGLGVAVNVGTVEIYTTVYLRKVA